MHEMMGLEMMKCQTASFWLFVPAIATIVLSITQPAGSDTLMNCRVAFAFRETRRTSSIRWINQQTPVCVICCRLNLP